MFENLVLIAIVLIAVWLGSYVLYLYSSNQHKVLQQDVESLQQDLQDSD